MSALLTEVTAVAVERLSPSFVRVELASPELADFGVDGPLYDQRVKLLFPNAAGELPVLGQETWWADYTALPEDERGHVRTYTIREVRGSGAGTRLVVDFVIHPAPHGPGSSWALGAEEGDRLLLLCPRRGEAFGGIEFTPTCVGRLLLVGDESAVPAVAAILDHLPADARGAVFLEVPHTDDVQKLLGPEGVEVTWLPRDDEVDIDLWETPSYSSSGEEVAPAAPPGGELYAWIAGEAKVVTGLRRLLVSELGFDRSQVAFMGYWRLGVAMRS